MNGKSSWQEELRHCTLCAWSCGVNRLAGEKGVCRLGLPHVAHACLHPAPPSSYTIFMAGCNFRCLFCQNWRIANHAAHSGGTPRPADAEETARTALRELKSPYGRLIKADRIFFSGGSPTPSFPWVEAVILEARRMEPAVKVNYDTNGFMSPGVFERMIELADSVTFDIRAISEEAQRQLTGAPPEPVLQNARRMALHPEKLWEFRVLVVPGLNVTEIPGICRFIGELGPELPVCFLAFRPNFYLERLRGATLKEMEDALRAAEDCGLKNVHWSGLTGLPGETPPPDSLELPCPVTPRSCGDCSMLAKCPVSSYHPQRTT